MYENKKTLFTKRVPGGGRSYFFDVHESDKTGRKYLLMTDSRKVDGEWKRERVMLFREQADELKEILEEAIRHLQPKPNS